MPSEQSPQNGSRDAVKAHRIKKNAGIGLAQYSNTRAVMEQYPPLLFCVYSFIFMVIWFSSLYYVIRVC